MNQKQIGNNIKQLRNELKMTQAELAHIFQYMEERKK